MSDTQVLDPPVADSIAISSARVLILDPFPCSGFGLQALSRWTNAVEVVQVEDSAANLPDRLDEHLPDVLLTDSCFYRQALAALNRHTPTVTKLVLWGFPPTISQVRALVESGIAGILSRTMAVPDILAALQLVTTGQLVLSKEATARLSDEASARDLSDVELRVLTLLADGLDNEDIAASTHVSESTVKRQLSMVLTKLGVSNRMQAVATAARGGLI